MKNDRGHTLHVISHTHWDREWYLTFEQFRARLVDLMDNLLELLDRDPDFRHFHLDGQTIVLDDYLAIRPENKQRLKAHIESGRLAVGPWYLLNDEFLTSGESHIRNLLYGHEMAQEFGRVTKIGYLPDQFGNVGQMPQVLRGFGIDNAIFGRGYSLAAPGRKMELLWRAPDGSEVLTHHLAFWYNNAQHFPADPDDAIAYTKAIIDRMAPVVTTRHLLLMNGVDHLEAQPNLSGILAGLSGELGEDTEIAQGSLETFIDALRQAAPELETWEGEFREDRGCQILAGTLSARMYLKQANERCQTELEQWGERWGSLAWWLGGRDDSALLTYAWKLLLQNHPHDSICGCSVDRVHQDMETRFLQSHEVARLVADRALASVAARVDTSTLPEGGAALVAFNPLCGAREEVALADIDFPIENGAPGRVKIVAPDGEEIPSQHIETRDIWERILDPHELPRPCQLRRFRLAFEAEAPGCGWNTHHVVAADGPPLSVEGVSADSNSLSNGLIDVIVLPGGALAVVDLENDLEFAPCNLFQSGGDVGDEYRYIPPALDRTVSNAGEPATVSLEACGPLVGRLRIDTDLQVPEGATADRRARADRTVKCPITTRVTVTRNSRRVDIETEVTNHERDHRLRALFASGRDTDVAHAESAFDVVTRPIQPPPDWTGASTFSPQQAFVAVEDDEAGLAVINQGLPEYEVLPDADRTIAITLLRCVGRLSGGAEGGARDAEYNETPGAQCQGTYRFRYAVLPYTGRWQEAEVQAEAHRHNAPVRMAQTATHSGALRPRESLLTVEPAVLVLSCVKQAERDDRLIVRVHNPTSEALNARIGLRGATGASLVALSEEEVEPLALVDGVASVEAAAKKIVTVAFQR